MGGVETSEPVRELYGIVGVKLYATVKAEKTSKKFKLCEIWF